MRADQRIGRVGGRAEVDFRDGLKNPANHRNI